MIFYIIIVDKNVPSHIGT